MNKGIGMAYPVYQEDLDRLGNMWWYVWGSSHYADPNYVPMSYAGEDPQLSPDYNEYILLFNEPGNRPPYGANITPEEGAVFYLQLKSLYPNAKFVVGNVSAWALDWLVAFKESCGCNPDVWGMHGYVEAWITPQMLFDLWEEAHNTLGGDFWITEWADTNANVTNDDKIQRWFKSHTWIKRWAYFTNRVKGDEEWYPPYWGNVSLFDWETGEPTAVGKWYIHGFYQTMLPIVTKP